MVGSIVMFVLEMVPSVIYVQFVNNPTAKPFVCCWSRQPCPAGQERLSAPPVTLLVKVAGPLGPTETTAAVKMPLVNVKLVPLTVGLTTTLPKLLGSVAPAPLNRVKV